MKIIGIPVVLIASYLPLIIVQALALLGRGAPVHYATHPCNLVVVFMHGQNGYLDVQWSLAKRVLQIVFGVGY